MRSTCVHWGMALLGFITLLMQGCGAEEASPPATYPPRQRVPGNVLPPREAPTEKGVASKELKLESLSQADFLARFRFRAMPKDYFIGTDFEQMIDSTLHHFERVEVVLPSGGRTEIRMQYFGAWAIWKNEVGNWEMLTTMTTASGTLMHFHTLDPSFVSLGSFEIARRTTTDMALTIRRGRFITDDTYEYTVATRSMGVLSDSIQGRMIVMPSGNYKVLAEESVKE